jgi:cysteine-rich repeat protein
MMRSGHPMDFWLRRATPILTVLLAGIGTAIAQEFVEATAAHRGTRKVVVDDRDAAGLATARALLARYVIDYPDRKVFVVPQEALASLPAEQRKSLSVRDDLDQIFLRSRTIDTTRPVPPVPPDLALAPSAAPQLYLLQFAGPVKEEWLAEVRSQGNVQVVSYLPSNAYLVRADGAAVEGLRSLITRETFLQFLGAYHPAYRIHPHLRPSGSGVVDVTVQFVEHDGVASSVVIVRGRAQQILRAPWVVGPYRNLRVRISEEQLALIARLPDVVNVEPWIEPRLFGERQGQIVADQIDGAGTQPVGPGYLAWLNALGFNSNFGFVVNVSDSGLDRGQTTADSVHPDFRDATANSRVSYVQRVTGTSIDTAAANNLDTDGHGTINAAIIGGFNDSTGSAFEDTDGYQFGLGIAPYALLGSSRIFAPSFTDPDHTELTNAAYLKGARVSSNSWGSSCFPNGCCPPGTLGDYTAESQEFDALTRDARPTTALDGGQAGNQEILIVFAAGNLGSCRREQLGNNGSTAKNTLVVGAGENFNQAGTDGCGVSNSGADNAQDVIGFSSRGPTVDDRIKPDIMAPGTHIYGAASQDPNYDGSGVCDQFRPVGQTLYAWSSGTSHSTPAVSGGAALARQWFLNQGRAAPSPAMTKAYLMNATTRMTGVGANDTLPSNVQGMGRLDLERSFDGAARILVDQTALLDATGETFQVSGAIQDVGTPFRVTVGWTDAVGATVGNAWVNDLDLEVLLDDGVSSVLYRGNNFSGEVSQPGGAADPRNNVESVWLPAGTTGTFTVTVRAQNLAGDGVPNVGDGIDQDFALVVYNGAPVVCGDSIVTPGEACDDGNTEDGDCCSSSCQFEGSGSPCDDGDACTDGDACNGAGTCDPGGPLVCDNSDVCDGTETCDSALGCQPGTPLVCDDSDVCDGTETCDSALGCQPGTPLVCDNSDVCDGTETCDSALGCQPGTPLVCDDSDACTADLCDELLGCGHDPIDCDDADPCTADSCDTQLGCVNDPIEACGAVPAVSPPGRILLAVLVLAVGLLWVRRRAAARSVPAGSLLPR